MGEDPIACLEVAEALLELFDAGYEDRSVLRGERKALSVAARFERHLKRRCRVDDADECGCAGAHTRYGRGAAHLFYIYSWR
jgi:hypothetical protein